jgi:hypothetical protein
MKSDRPATVRTEDGATRGAKNLPAMIHSHRLTLAALACCGLAAPSVHAQSTWHVDDDALGPGTGVPGDPYPSIQAALDAAATQDGDTILVADGVYAPIDFVGKSVAIVAAPGGTVAVDATGLGVPCVVARTGEGAGTRLEGVTLRNGVGLPTPAGASGGGVHLDGATLMLDRCTIDACSGPTLGGGIAAQNGAVLEVVDSTISLCLAASGGGIAVVDSTVTLIGSDVSRNNFSSHADFGGGLFARASQVWVEDCVFDRNRAFRGAGVGVELCLPTFQRCEFRGHTAVLGCLHGAAIAGSGLVQECTFVGNRAQFGGALYGALQVEDSLFDDNGFDQFEASFGGAFHSGGQPGASALRCVFRGNFAFGQGGATHGVALVECEVTENRNFGYSSAQISARGGGVYGGSAVDTLFVGNEVFEQALPFLMEEGGGAYGAALLRCTLRGNLATFGGAAASSTIDRCTIVANEARQLAGGVHGAGTIVSSIVRDNLQGELGGAGGTSPIVSYSNILGGAPGPGNFDLDPRFFGPLAHDYHLAPGSPCVDAGDPSAFDPDGSRADVGAYPFDPQYVGAPSAYCTAKVTSIGCVPRIGASGVPSLTGVGFDVHVDEVLSGTIGLVFWSRDPAAFAYAGGTLCLSPPFVRTPPLVATTGGPCDGRLARTFTAQDLAAAGLLPGDRMHLQWFFRDASHPDGTGLGLSDALEATIVP